MLKGTLLLTGADLIGGLLEPSTWVAAVATAFVYKRFFHAGKWWGGIAVTCLVVIVCLAVSPQGVAMGLAYKFIAGMIHRRKVATT